MDNNTLPDNNSSKKHLAYQNKELKKITREDIHNLVFSEEQRNAIKEEKLSAARGAKELYSSFISNIYRLKEETLSVLSQSELDSNRQNEYDSQVERWDGLIDSIEMIDDEIKESINVLLEYFSIFVKQGFDQSELITKEGFKCGLGLLPGTVPAPLQSRLYLLTTAFVMLGGNIIAIMKTRQKIISLFSATEKEKELLDYVVEKLLPGKKETNEKLGEILDAIMLRNKEDGYNAVTQERFAEICWKALLKKYPWVRVKKESLQRTFSNWDAHKYKTAIAEGYHENRHKGEDFVKQWAKQYFVPYYMKQNRGKYRRKRCGETAFEEAAIQKFKEDMQRIDDEDDYVSVSQKFLRTLVEIIEEKYLKQ